jgi:hypothetical protein
MVSVNPVRLNHYALGIEFDHTSDISWFFYHVHSSYQYTYYSHQ